jgi:hypothetical protein
MRMKMTMARVRRTRGEVRMGQTKGKEPKNAKGKATGEGKGNGKGTGIVKLYVANSDTEG